MNIAELSIKQIEALFASGEITDEIVEALRKDSRAAAGRLVKRYERQQKEIQRIEAMYRYEKEARNEGHSNIAGVDEAGRGPLAGPVSVAAVILPDGLIIPKINDSKKLSEKVRNELYLEAEHDGKTFTYQETNPIDFQEETNSKGELLGYRAYISFENRNLYSKSDKWNLTLRDCHDGTILASETVSQKPSPCGYTVYTGDHGYESPFVDSISVNRNLEPGKPYHMIYNGKGGSFPVLEKGTMIVFSYCYYYDGKSKMLYVPFLGVQTKSDENGVCSIDFSIKEPGQYKIDFYDVTTGEINLTSNFDYLTVRDDVDLKRVEKKGTRWKVNSAEGLRLRDSPWGEKIALLENGTELIQTEETHYPFYDFIDAHGFWIPVKYADKTSQNQEKEKKHVYCLNEEETVGWVFSGFLSNP